MTTERVGDPPLPYAKRAREVLSWESALLDVSGNAASNVGQPQRGTMGVDRIFKKLHLIDSA